MQNIEHDIKEIRSETKFYMDIISKNRDYLNGCEIANPIEDKFKKQKNENYSDYKVKYIDLHSNQTPKKTIFDDFTDKKIFNVIKLFTIINKIYYHITNYNLYY